MPLVCVGKGIVNAPTIMPQKATNILVSQYKVGAVKTAALHPKDAEKSEINFPYWTL